MSGSRHGSKVTKRGRTPQLSNPPKFVGAIVKEIDPEFTVRLMELCPDGYRRSVLHHFINDSLGKDIGA